MEILKKNAGFIVFVIVIAVIGYLIETQDLSFTLPFVDNVSDSAETVDDTEDLYKRAREFDANGQWERSVTFYSTIIDRNPNDTNAYVSRCGAYYRMGKFNHAITDCSAALDINPNVTDAMALLCYSQNDAGYNEKAIETCTRLIEKDSSYSGAFTSRADAYLDLGKDELALADYDQAIQIDPTNSTAYNNRAILHEDMGNIELALADYDKSLQYSDPAKDFARHIGWHNRGMLHQELGNWDKAIYDFRKALDIYPTYIRAMISLADTLNDLGRLPQALDLYKTVIELEENGVADEWSTDYIPAEVERIEETIARWETVLGDHVTLVYQGWEAQARENYPLAVETFTEIIEAVPDAYLGYYLRAQALEAGGLNAEALADYETYRELAIEAGDYPVDTYEEYNVDYNIDNLSAFAGIDPQAVDLYQQALELYDEPEESLSLYSQAIELAPDFADAYLQRAYVYEYSVMDWARALADYRKYDELDADSDLSSSINRLAELTALPEDAQSCLKAIDDYFYDYDYDDDTVDDHFLIEQYTCVIDSAPDYAPAYLSRAEEYRYSYQYALAISDYETYLKLNPDEGESVHYTYDDYYVDPAYELAILRQYMALPEEALDAWIDAQESRYSYEEEDTTHTLESLNIVIEADPTFDEALLMRATIYDEAGEYETALADYQAYVALIEDDDSYTHGRITEIEQLLMLPDDLQTLYHEGQEAENFADYDTAIDAYSQILAQQPDFVTLYYQRGILYYYLSEYELARQDFVAYQDRVSGEESSEVDYLLDYIDTMLDLSDGD